MIEFTIKTLDSNDHQFSVDDEITVEQLKQKVLEQMGVPIDLQRLIFCGRVLQDSRRLADYGVHGKVVHMVQRAPPCLEERERGQENAVEPSRMPDVPNFGPINFNQITPQQIRRLMALAASVNGIEIEETPAHDLSPTASRLEFLRRLIIEIRTSLDALRENESDEPRTYSTDDPLEADSQPHRFPEEVICPFHQRPLLYQIDHGFGATREGRGSRIRSMRPNYHTPPQDFGLLVEELHELDDEFALFRELYINTLRDASDPDIRIPEETLQRRQRTADLCAELYHSFSHAYHSISDVGLLLSHSNSRLTSEALMRHPLPVQASINVMPPSPPAPAPENPPAESAPLEGQEAPLALPEFENLFRGLRQSDRIGGVEVVMSMEELPQVNLGVNNTSGPSTDSQSAESGAYIAQTADFFHEIVTSVFRQGLFPAVNELFQVQETVGHSQSNPTQGQSQGSAQPHPQSQFLLQHQFSQPFQPQPQPQPELPTQTQNQSQNPQQTTTQDRSQRVQSNNERNANTNSTNQQTQNPRNEAVPRIRTQTVSVFDLVYDRFLQCDSQHARRQLQIRRDESLQQGGLRLRDAASSRIQNNVETLFERFNRYVLDDESLLIAGTVLLREGTSFSTGRTLEPHELAPLRHRMLVYMRFLMQGEYEDGNQERLTDLIFERHSAFLYRIHLITPIRPNIDVIASMRAVFVRFLNEAMLVLQISDIEVFSRRCRIIYPRMFYELCGVLSYCSLERVTGLTMIYRSFITDLIQHIDEPVRDLLYSLSMENLDTALARVTANKIHYPQFIRRINQPSCSASSSGPSCSFGPPTCDGSSGSGVVPMDVEVGRSDAGNQSSNADAALPMELTSEVDQTLLPKEEQADEMMETTLIESEIATSTPERPGRATLGTYPQTPRPLQDQATIVSEEGSSTADSFDEEKDERNTAQNCAGFREELLDDSESAQENEDIVERSSNMTPSSTGEAGFVENAGSQDDAEKSRLMSSTWKLRSDISTADSLVASAGMTKSLVSKIHEHAIFNFMHTLSEEGSALNITEIVFDNGIMHELPLDASRNFGPFRDSTVDGGYWGTSRHFHTDPPQMRRSPPIFTNLFRFRRELLRYPGALEKAQALLGGSPNRSTPSPPLETVIVDHPTGRRNYVGGIVRREIPHPLVAELMADLRSSPTPRAIEAPRDSDDSGACASNMPNRNRSRRPRSDSPEPTDSASFVLPAQIAQYLGDQWVPTFTRDLQQQQAETDEPSSDAYLSGMSPSKRRCVRQARPPQEPEVLVRESLQDILQQGVPRRGDTISSAFRDHFRRYLSTHSVASQNYDPRRYKSAARFLTYTRKNNKAQEEKTKQ